MSLSKVTGHTDRPGTPSSLQYRLGTTASRGNSLTKRKLFEVGHFSFPDCRTPGPQRRRPGPTACSGFCWHFPMSPGSPPAELQAQSGPRPRGPGAPQHCRAAPPTPNGPSPARAAVGSACVLGPGLRQRCSGRWLLVRRKGPRVNRSCFPLSSHCFAGSCGQK